MKKILGLITVFLMLFSTFPAIPQAIASTEVDKPTMVNIQVDLEKEGDQTFVYNVLTELESRGWYVTVYVTGEFALNHPDVVKDIHDRGHQIAVHGWRSGEDLTQLSYQAQFEQISNAFTAVRTAVGNMAPQYVADFRP